MLSRIKIRELTHASFYARGLDLYLDKHVKEMYIQENSYVDEVTARVDGSGSKTYKTEFSYDNAVDGIIDCYCDCPAYASYDGLCKHLVAAMLSYADARKKEEKRTRREVLLRSIDERRRGLAEPYEPQTSRPLRELLAKRAMKQATVLYNDSVGQVELLPSLTVSGRSCQVDFRIGIRKKYVLKDVIAFSAAMNTAETVSYGKELTFTHVPEAFAPKSRRLLQFIMRWVSENRQGYSNYRYYGGEYYNKIRSISLSSSQLEDLMDASWGLPVQISMNGGAGALLRPEVYSREFKDCYLTEGAPERSIVLLGKDDGAQLQLQEPLCFYGSRRRFSVCDNRIYAEEYNEQTVIEEFRSCMAQQGYKPLYIQREDLPVFCRDILPELEKYYICTRESFSEEDYQLTPVTFEIFLDAPQEDMISCRVIAVYGEKRYNVYGSKEDIGQRDMEKELRAGRAAAAYCNTYDERSMAMVLAGDEEKMYEFLVEGIEELRKLGEVYISDALKRFRVSSSPKVSVGLSLAGDLLELRMETEDMSREELLEILCKYDRRKKYYRLKNGEFINVAGEDLETLWELKQGLGLTERQLKQDTIALPKYRALYLDSRLREQESLQTYKDRAFKSLVRNMKTVEDNDFEIPPSLAPILREYQKKGFLWLKTLCYNGFGGILADDMGLGKTLQVIAFLSSELEAADEVSSPVNRRCLIVTPASLVYNWYSEFKRFAPKLPVVMAAGGAKERESVIKEAAENQRVILITSYDLLKRDIEQYAQIPFFCQVIDEAQFIKNHNTQACRAVKEIQAGCRLALTGTPVENRLSELWSVFDYLMPGFFFSYQRFREELEQPIVQQQDTKAMERLQKMIRPFVLRRLKKDVLKDLPDKLEEEMYAGMEGEQREIYDAHVKRLALMLDKQSDEEFSRGKIQILSELTRLRQLCCDPSLIYENYAGGSAKLEMCMELVRNAVNGGHKILLFSQFTSMLELLYSAMEQEGITFYALTGATGKERRKELVEQFNRDDTSVFCISLKAGGTGLNLTAADIVIHYDPWWNLAVQNQATDRAHRIGQRNTVTVYKLVAKDTIEENIMRLQEKKRQLADQVLAGEGLDSGSFTREELREIIGM